MSILFPLYVYPSAGAWDPLYTAAKAHRNVDFTVILNPCSGPCMGSLPDNVYLNEVPKLRSYPNIRTLGYVATHYAEKPIEDVLAEIDVYAKWPKLTNITKMKVDVFDETPSTFSPTTYTYLHLTRLAVLNTSSFHPHNLIAHNPGLLPATTLLSPSPQQTSYLNLSDITVIFEETFTKWLDKSVMRPLQQHNIPREKVAVIVHSAPEFSREVLEWVVGMVEGCADWVFLTSQGGKGEGEEYHAFGGMFGDLVGAVDGWRGGRRR